MLFKILTIIPSILTAILSLRTYYPLVANTQEILSLKSDSVSCLHTTFQTGILMLAFNIQGHRRKQKSIILISRLADQSDGIPLCSISSVLAVIFSWSPDYISQAIMVYSSWKHVFQDADSSLLIHTLMIQVTLNDSLISRVLVRSPGPGWRLSTRFMLIARPIIRDALSRGLRRGFLRFKAPAFPNVVQLSTSPLNNVPLPPSRDQIHSYTNLGELKKVRGRSWTLWFGSLKSWRPNRGEAWWRWLRTKSEFNRRSLERRTRCRRNMQEGEMHR